MIRYKCQRCRTKLESPESLAGGTDICPVCKQKVPVPLPKRKKHYLPVSIAGGLLLVAGIVVAVLLSPDRGGPKGSEVALSPDASALRQKHSQLLENARGQFNFVPVQEWKGLKFIFLERSKESQKYGYQSFEGGKGKFGHPAYAEAVGRVGTVTEIRSDSSETIFYVDLTMDDNGQVYTGTAYTGMIHDIAPVADIEKARALWKDKPLWLISPHRLTDEIVSGLARYDKAGDKPEYFFVRRFEGVRIVDVVPGYYSHHPVRFVMRTDSGQEGFLDCSLSGTNGWVHRKESQWEFDRYFFLEDPRKLFPWDANIWKALEDRSVFLGMTKAQAILSWGEPMNVNKTITADGTRELWTYARENWLQFDNGLLAVIHK